MRIIIAVFVFICLSCGGSLSSEQRKKIRANMEAKSIKKISDAELTEAAFSYARTIAKIIETRGVTDPIFLDSLSKAYQVQILFMGPGDQNLRSVERQILEAYVSSTGSVNPGDNLQKMGSDSLLYTKPLLKERANKTLEFTKALAVRLHKKVVILSIKE